MNDPAANPHHDPNTQGTELLGENGPLASMADWAEAFQQAGQALGLTAREGTLRRGLREVIGYLMIFR